MLVLCSREKTGYRLKCARCGCCMSVEFPRCPICGNSNLKVERANEEPIMFEHVQKVCEQFGLFVEKLERIGRLEFVVFSRSLIDYVIKIRVVELTDTKEIIQISGRIVVGRKSVIKRKLRSLNELERFLQLFT